MWNLAVEISEHFNSTYENTLEGVSPQNFPWHSLPRRENFYVYVSKFLNLSVLLKVVLSLQAVLFLGNSYNEYHLKVGDTYKF
jgi:tetrahydromethanopterin S-methyltransferase subunit B